MATVATCMAPLWRLAGNPAFDQSQQFIFDRLTAAGLTPRYDAMPDRRPGWEHVARHGQARRGDRRSAAVA